MANYADDDFRYSNGGRANCGGGWTAWYRHPESGEVYQICRDTDGFRVRLPHGAIDAVAGGETWRSVKESYGFPGATPMGSMTCGADCNDDRTFSPLPPTRGPAGCFGADTLILMADGSQRPISQLDVGDRVYSTHGFPGHVFEDSISRILVEPHNKIVNLSTGAGTTLTLSARQPLMTTSGPVRSEFLFDAPTLVGLKDDKLAAEPIEQLARLAETKGTPVELYSLVLENLGYFFVGEEKFGAACEVIPGDIKH